MGQKTAKFEVFNRDIQANDGYRYTTHIGLSSRLATKNSVESVMFAGQFKGKNLIDIGCGDGHYTLQYYDSVQPKSIVAIDGAERAIELALKRKMERAVTFLVGDSHNLPFANDSFDVALLQAMLHHDDAPLQTIREALRVAPEVVIHEPNGCNLGLKISRSCPATIASMRKYPTPIGAWGNGFARPGARWCHAGSLALSPCFAPAGLHVSHTFSPPWSSTRRY